MKEKRVEWDEERRKMRDGEGKRRKSSGGGEESGKKYKGKVKDIPSPPPIGCMYCTGI